jgi:uncharacterized protein YndB with AHSA1/START domain
MAIEHRTLVRAPREAVYRALTTADGLDEWFTTGAEVVPEPGGIMHLRWREWGRRVAQRRGSRRGRRGPATGAVRLPQARQRP